MDSSRTIAERVRTAAILLSGVIPLVLQPGPVAGEAVAARHVDRLLDEFPETDGELPNELVLQCHLISLVSDAVTLRATEVGVQSLEGPQPDLGNDAPSREIKPLVDVSSTTQHLAGFDLDAPASNHLLPEQPRGP